MSDIPHQTVFRSVVDVVQGDGQLNRTQPGGEVSAGAAHRFNHKLAQLSRQPLELRQGQLAKLLGIINHLQQRR